MKPESSESQLLIPVPVEAAWPNDPRPDAGYSPHSPGLSVYAHAFRRRGVAAVLIGLVLAGAAAPAVWSTWKPTYTAMASFHIAANEARILFAADRNTTEFGIYKSTQQQYLTSRFVLIAALRASELADSRRLRDELDPIGWLAGNLRVNFPGNAEIMNVSLRGDDARETAALVNAVIDAYVTEIVDVEHSRRRQRLNDLDQIYSEKETELRSKRSQLKQLAEQLGSSERDTLNLRAQLAMQQFAALRSELSSTQFRMMRMRGELKSKQNALQRAEQMELSDEEMERALAADPTGARLLQGLNELTQRQQELDAAAHSGAAAGTRRRYQEAETRARELLEARRGELRENLERTKIVRIETEVQQLQAELGVLAEQEQQLQQEVEQARKHAESFGGSSIDIEMMRSEIALVERTLTNVADEREKLLIEIRNRPRISLIHRATLPTVPDRDKKLQTSVLAGLAGLGLPIALLLWWDVRGRRVSSSHEISPGTGLIVLGGVPLLPGRVLRNSLAEPSARHREWRELLNESVDGIAVRLLHLAEREQVRVVLVASAVSGEGKTTLATQLAASLARTAHRTLLVDCDLRRPAIHRMLDVPLEPGVTEVLHGQTPLQDAIHQTELDHLWVLPAGRGGGGHLNVLSNGALKAMFSSLRDEFEFVVVDGSPILPVPDTRLLCRHVDGVVLCVLRDVSSLPNIQAACHILSGFAVRPLGAVVTGHDATGYRSYRAE